MNNSTTNGHQTAKQAGLRYGMDDVPGIQRKMKGPKAHYVSARGREVRDSRTLARIRGLAIPPAWTDVWIAATEDQHLQATGRDAKGRKQYRYQPRWRQERDAAKYENLISFARSLPRIRRRVRRDLKRRGLPREKVLAAVTRLLETSLIRVGNDEYARQNNSFGLTTMQDRHAHVRGQTVRLHFRGKSGIMHEIDLESPTLARIVKRCQDLPGQELFQYLDEDGTVRDIGSADVNNYLRTISGVEISAKDFRTWAATALAAQALQEFEEFDSDAGAKRNVRQAIERVASRLGNTASVCRKCYVHPAVIDAYMDRSLLSVLQQRAEGELRGALSALKPEEATVLALLQERLKRDLGNGRGRRRAKSSSKSRSRKATTASKN
jgi:DNA topoisomerase-1